MSPFFLFPSGSDSVQTSIKVITTLWHQPPHSVGGGQDNDLPFILYSSPQVNVFIIVNHLNDIMHKADVLLMFYLGFKGLGHRKIQELTCSLGSSHTQFLPSRYGSEELRPSFWWLKESLIPGPSYTVSPVFRMPNCKAQGQLPLLS